MGVNMKGLIFGATLKSAHTRLEKLIKDYKYYWDIEPERICKSSYDYSVIFQNGDYWHATRLSDHSRGRRAHVILVDKNVSIKDIMIAEHCLVNKPYGSLSYY
jgi:hypothetical protein